MTVGQDMDREPAGDDVVAAEYVLGVQSAEDRRATAIRIETDRDFAALVEAWEAHFSPLGSLYPEVEPPHGLKGAIDRLLFSSTAVLRSPSGTGFWHNLLVWRTLAISSLAALLVTLALPLLAPLPEPVQPERLIAGLGAEGSDVHYMAVFEGHEIGLAHVSGEREGDRDFELWIIEGQDPPISLGVIPEGVNVRLRIDDDLAARIAAGAVFAITLEPSGGSPTGRPTGPVVAAGDLRDI